MVERERAEALERQRQAEYTVWRKREGFQERRGDREKEDKSSESGRETVPEVIWRKRGQGEAERERTRALQRGQETVWRKREIGRASCRERV